MLFDRFNSSKMLAIGQSVKLKDRKMLPDLFENIGTVVKLHSKDSRICWVCFPLKGDDDPIYSLNLHEVELEVLNE